VPPEPSVGDDLYDVAPNSFVAARDALVRELKAGGARETADQVAAMRRPTRSAWALNQVARREPALIDAYLDSVAVLRAATDDALAGDATGVRPAQHDERAAVDAIVSAATGYLKSSDEGASAAIVERVADSVRAAGADEASAATVRAGRLQTDLSATTLGLDGFGFTSPDASPRRPSRSPSKQAQLDRAATDAEQLAAQLLSDAVRARADADEAEDFARRAQAAAGSAERRAETAQRKAEQARDRAEAKRTSRP
jgi:hypothetical protein